MIDKTSIPQVRDCVHLNSADGDDLGVEPAQIRRYDSARLSRWALWKT
jgi:hypothetical protein